MVAASIAFIKDNVMLTSGTTGLFDPTAEPDEF